MSKNLKFAEDTKLSPNDALDEKSKCTKRFFHSLMSNLIGVDAISYH